MENDTRLIISGFILDFAKWDHTINLFVMKFHKKFNVYPNILLASVETYKEIDLYAQKHPERIIKYDDDGNLETLETSDDSYEGLSKFIAIEYSLDCCIEYDLKEGYFTLIFDGDPDFSGEPIIEDEGEEAGKIYHFRKSA